MIPYQRVVNHVFAEPFELFQIRTTSGMFEVRHPDSVRMGRRTLAVYVSPGNDPDGPHRWEEVALASIESIAALTTVANTNGR